MNEIIMMPIGDVHPYLNNPRINEAAIDKVAASIREFGFRQPIVVDKDNVIIAGHTRLQAALRLGMKEIPVVVAEDLTEEQVRAYRLADNKTAEFAEWDFDKLDEELSGILDIDMTDFGFEFEEEQPEVVEDDFEPELPEEPKAQRGDIYILGRHRLMCGDSTSVDDVEKLVNGAQVDMLLTDPPYNVDMGNKNEFLERYGKASKTRIKEAEGIQNDKMSSESFAEFLVKSFLSAKSVMKNGAVFHIWYGESEAYNFRGACKEAGLTVRQQLVWVKNIPLLSRQDFQHQYESVLTGDNFLDEEMEGRGYEPCLYGWKDGAGHKWYKKRKEKDVLFFDKPRSSAEHPTMKPVLLFDYEMQCNTRAGDNVLDLFAGSGTTIISAEQNGRTAYCMELDPRYVDVIIARWEAFTGQKAVLV